MQKNKLVNAKNNNVKIIILKYDNQNIKSKTKSYNYNIFGLKMIDWVKTACSGYPTKTISLNPSLSVVENIKPHITNNGYTVVLFCDTPLVNKAGLQDIIDYAVLKNVSFLTCARCYVVNNEYIKNNENYTTQSFTHHDHMFLMVKNFGDLAEISQELQKQINSQHMINGVNIINSSTVYIDKNVVIKKGVTIHQNNTIKNNSVIYEDAEIHPNNYIDNTIVKQNAKIHCSHLVNCVVAKNANVKPFSYFSNILVNE